MHPLFSLLGYNFHMHFFEYILIMLAAVLASSFVGARFPRVPTPLLQIATGIALTLLPISFEMSFEPELFMVLFVAPLLFDDAKKMDKTSLWRYKYPVLCLALGLVFCTVLVLGFAVNFFAPSIPLAAAFALAAALAPTDAVSVDSVKKNATISNAQSKLLQGEALLNDASSIVSFNFAVAAAITGAFSLWEAGGTFLLMFFGGLALGVVLMLFRNASLYFLRARGVASISFFVLFEIITPFLIYLLAELLHVSGIIAVVAAGIAHSFAPRLVTPSSARLNVVSTSVWSVISFTLNGLVFLMLGTQLPYVAERVWTETAVDTNFLILLVVLILLVILGLRFLWILVMNRNVNVASGKVELTVDEDTPVPLVDESKEELELLGPDFDLLNAEKREEALERMVAFDRLQMNEARAKRRKIHRKAVVAEREAARSDPQYWKHHLYDALLLSLSGVKGSITLAIILSIPLTISGLEPFPERNLLVFLASGVIVLSLLVANIVVPLIAPLKKQAPQPASELKAILKIYRKVITDLTAGSEPEESSAVGEVVRQYHYRINTLKANNCLELPNEAKVRRYVIELQLENTQRLTDDDRINNLTALLYINSLSHQLARAEHHNTVLWELKAFIRQFSHRWKMIRSLRGRTSPGADERLIRRYDIHALQIDNYRYAIKRLSGHEPTDDLPAHTVDIIRVELEQRLLRLEARWDRNGITRGGRKRAEEEQILVEARALDLEREAIKEAYEEGSISSETAKMLRDNVALMELDIEDQLE